MTRLLNWGRYLRRSGLMAAGQAFVERFVYRSHRCLITYNPLAGPPAVDRVGDVVFRLATPPDFERLDELEPYGRGSTHRTYVARDHDWLFVGCDGERIVATRRAGRVVRDPIVSRVIQLEEGQIWGADVFCLPEYRNRGIARHLQRFGDRYLATLGYKERLGTIVVTNTPSLRMSRAGGKVALYYVSYVRVLGWERLRVSKDIPRQFWEDVAAPR